MKEKINCVGGFKMNNTTAFITVAEIQKVLEISESISKLDGFNGKVMCANIVAFF